MDAQTQQVLADFSQEIRRLRGQVDSLQRAARTPQLAHSSLEEGQAIETRSEDGTTRQLIGWLPDGTVGMITEGGDPVSAPTAPTVTPSLGGLRVTWDGTLSDELALPGDFDHMAVHVSTTPVFVPSAATYVGSIRRAGEGGMLPVVPLPYVEHYVRLVPVTTGGVQGVPSAEVAATPLQTSGVDLQADSIEAVHIKAGAVEASKLEAVLALVTTIIAGIPGAARAEMDQDGLRGYNESNELVFAIDSSGNAVFSGDITGSLITGSRMIIGAAPNARGFIESLEGAAQMRATSPAGPNAQLRATGTHAELSVWAESVETGVPVGVLSARTGQVYILQQSSGGDASQPWTGQSVESGAVYGRWASGTGSEIAIHALVDYANILLTAPPATDPDDAQGSGYIFTQRLSNDIAAVSMQGPVWTSGSGLERGLRAMLHAEGARPDRTYTRMAHSAARHLFQGQYRETTSDIDTADGVVEVAATHSILAPRHAPLRSDMVSNPSFGTTGAFVSFTSGQMPPISFKTGWSGRVRVTITAAGSNSATSGSQIDLGFSLSGGSTVPAARARSWIGTASVVQHGSRVVHLNLVGNADYVLTPAWRITSGSSSTASYVLSFENSIVVEPLM